jgi:hypothetical protein
MPVDLFPKLHARLGVPRSAEPLDDLERAQRRELAEMAERDLQRGRSTDLSDFRTQYDSRQRAKERRQKADPSRVIQILSRLVTSIAGVPLSQIVPVAPGIPGIIGADLRGSEFDEFLGQFLDVLSDLGFRPRVPVLPANSAARGDVRRQLAARAIGCSAPTADNVVAPPSRYARRFDDLSSALSDGRTVSAVLGSGFDGLPPGSFEAVSAMITAIQNSLRAGDDAGARQAGTDAGILIAALHSVFGGGTTAQRAAAPVRVRKATNRVVAIEVGSDRVETKDADLSSGVPRRRGAIRFGKYD